MMAGFTKVDRRTFHLEIWPRIVEQVDAVESNWKACKKGARPLIIKWGYIDENTGEPIILAISSGDDDITDEHWVIDTLLPVK
ncbi:MAG: hypothetical protein V4695_10160 [Pseudomonadota bacterium]